MASAAKYLRARDLCERFGISKSTLYKMLGEGHLPRPIRVSGVVRWPLAEIEGFEARLLADRRSR